MRGDHHLVRQSLHACSCAERFIVHLFSIQTVYLIFLEPPLPYRNTSRGEENVTGGSGGASGNERDAKRLEHGPRPHGSPSW